MELKKYPRDYDIVMTIQLTGPIAGSAIVAAFKAVVENLKFGQMVQEIQLRDEVASYILCNVSSYPYKDLQLRVDGGDYISPEKYYSDEIEVIYQPWVGSKYAIGYEVDSIIYSMKQFRDALQAELAI